MDRAIAFEIVVTADKAASELARLIPFIADEDRSVKIAIGATIFDLMENIIVPIRADFPGL